MNNFVEFIKRNLGAIIGLVIGIIFVLCGLSYFVVNLAVMIGFAYLGRLFQYNKETVKEKLKSWIDKI